MDSLDLDPCGYAGTYKLIGGRLSLDFVNTVSWPGTERHHDWLQTPSNVRRWLDANDLVAPEVAVTDLDAIRALRTVISAMVRPLAHGDRPSAAVVNRFNGRLAVAAAHRRLDPAELTWSWDAPRRVIDAFAPVVVDTADLVAVGDQSRLKRCPSCDWVFVDTTRNGGRRWCDMADCGSRAKARSYYQRSKS